ncbi:helix-turn-helix domain-containing protein [Paenibacillus sanguinis]|uniref:helix-turn-helix domain-containing protein n=1 Tax=Paenibacillus sanguinis TaxID=225906 RepID=UPI00035D3B04|nr:helix-turn-helix transcriptional regulator [Paenibacillus sanguinis]
MGTIGERLKRLREEQHISLNDLAMSTNLSKGNLSSYENNKIKPSADALISLSDFYNISIDWILTGKNRTPLQSTGTDETSDYSTDEKSLIKIFRLLTERQKGKVERYVEEMLEDNEAPGSSIYRSGEETATSEKAG